MFILWYVGKVAVIRMAMDKEDIEYRRQVVQEYKADVEKLIRYLPWLEEKSGSNVSETYSGSGIGEHSIAFPVYDSTLLSFVKEVQRTDLLDRNYRYIYSRNRIVTQKDELRAISNSDITRMDILKGILSKYVMGGMTKGRMWTEAVQNRIFLNIVRRTSKRPIHLTVWHQRSAYVSPKGEMPGSSTICQRQIFLT